MMNKTIKEMNTQQKFEISALVKCILIFLLSTIFSGNIFSQPEQHREEVRVIRSYNPMIDDAFKININPVITDTVVPRMPLEYTITPLKLSTDIDVSPIRAARMRGLPTTELFPLLVKGGFGNYTTPYFEVFYNSLRSRIGSYGIHYKHISSNGGIEDYAYNGYSENRINLSSTLFGRDHIFNFSGAYSRDIVHFFGRPEGFINDTLSKDDIRQRFHQVEVKAGVASNYYFGDKMDHSFNVGYNLINDLYETTEHHAEVDGNISKLVQWFAFSRTQTIGLDLGFDFFSSDFASNNNTPAMNAALAKVNPYFEGRVKDMEFRAGIAAEYESDNNGALKFFPDINIKIAMKQEKFIITGGLQGGMHRNSFRKLANENPFVVSSPDIRNTTTKIRVFGGINTAIGNRFNFNAKVAAESIENLAMFVKDTSLLFMNRFDMLYDDGSLLMLKGELSYQAAEKFKVTGALTYIDYNMNNEGYAYHIPAFTSSLELRYNLQDKIITYAGIKYLTGIKVKTYEKGIGVADDLNPIFDLNIGAEYRYSKQLSGFIRLNNLTASRYYRWQYYPSQRLNIMLGVTYAI